MAARFLNAYTSAEDAMIFAAIGKDGLAVLAIRFGRTYSAIKTRRSKLRRIRAAPKMALADIAPVLRHRQSTLGLNFSRPDWFSEDLTKIALARR